MAAFPIQNAQVIIISCLIEIAVGFNGQDFFVPHEKE